MTIPEFPPLMDLVRGAAREQLPMIVGHLSEAYAAAIARLHTPPPPAPEPAEMPSDLPAELTPEDIARDLRLMKDDRPSVGMIYRLRTKGRNPLPMRHVGKYLRCSRAEYLAWKARETAIARGRRG